MRESGVAFQKERVYYMAQTELLAITNANVSLGLASSGASWRFSKSKSKKISMGTQYKNMIGYEDDYLELWALVQICRSQRWARPADQARKPAQT